MNRGFLKQLAYLFAINLACSALLMTWQAQAQERRAPAAPAGSSTGLVSYQGRLTDGSGRPLSGQYNLVFRLYDTPTGGTPLWEETWSGASAVSVSDGLFSLLLGSHNPTLPAAVAGHDTLYLGITVDTDAELSPRTQLGSAPIALYALQADVADGAVTTAKLADGAVTAAKLHPALQTTILRGFTPAVYSDRVSPEVSEGLHIWTSNSQTRVNIAFKVPDDYVSGDLTVRMRYWEHDTGPGTVAVFTRHIWRYRKADGVSSTISSGPANYTFGSSFQVFTIPAGGFEAGDLLWMMDQRDGANAADTAGRLDLMAIGVEYLGTGR